MKKMLLVVLLSSLTFSCDEKKTYNLPPTNQSFNTKKDTVISVTYVHLYLYSGENTIDRIVLPFDGKNLPFTIHNNIVKWQDDKNRICYFSGSFYIRYVEKDY
jgi:hypothetical protein